jgi:hypothetical protein
MTAGPSSPDPLRLALACEGFHELGYTLGTASGPWARILQFGHEPLPPSWLAVEARSRSFPRSTGGPGLRCTRLTRTSSSLSISWINRKRQRPVVWVFPVSDGSHPRTTAAIPAVDGAATWAFSPFAGVSLPVKGRPGNAARWGQVSRYRAPTAGDVRHRRPVLTGRSGRRHQMCPVMSSGALGGCRPARPCGAAGARHAGGRSAVRPVPAGRQEPSAVRRVPVHPRTRRRAEPPPAGRPGT